MSQVSVCSRTAQGRSSWRALRPVLLLGGFVAIWWALMTGVAQAESTPHHLVDGVTSQVKPHHNSAKSPVRGVVRRVHHDVKVTTSKSTSHLRQETSPVTRTAVEVAQATRAAPIVNGVTKSIRTTVSDTVAKTRSLLAKTAVGPVVDKVENTVKNADSSTLQGNSHSPRHSVKSSTESFAELLSSTCRDQSEPSAAPIGKRASIDADAPVDGPRGAPAVHDPCTSPSGSSSPSVTPVGTTEPSSLAVPTVVRDLHVGRLARLLDGPAYEPGSSPD